jgi:hypothetical protein
MTTHSGSIWRARQLEHPPACARKCAVGAVYAKAGREGAALDAQQEDQSQRGGALPCISSQPGRSVTDTEREADRLGNATKGPMQEGNGASAVVAERSDVLPVHLVHG